MHQQIDIQSTNCRKGKESYPPLSGNISVSEACPVCDGATEFQFSAKILYRHTVKYFQCKHCGLLQTEKPYWLDEAYNEAIAETDTGLVRRNLNISMRLSSLLYFLIERKGKYVDAAGGYGLLTRMMRDIGFDYYWSDKHCTNLLARGFDIDQISPPFTAVTAFEVLEHIHDPLNFLSDLLKQFKTRTIIFSTTLFEGTPPQPGQWWYYAFETGQHISFFQRRTLQAIADALGLQLLTHGWMHMMTDIEVNPTVFSILSGKPGVALSYYVQARMKTKTISDQKLLSERVQVQRD